MSPVGGNPIRVMLVESSSLVERALRAALESRVEFLVVESTMDIAKAAELVGKVRPDVLLLAADQRRDSLVPILSRVMAESPTPVIILKPRAPAVQIPPDEKLLSMGAVAIFERPGAGSVLDEVAGIIDSLSLLIQRVSRVKVVRILCAEGGGPDDLRRNNSSSSRSVDSSRASSGQTPRMSEGSRLVVIGSSTGGPTALLSVIRDLPVDLSLPVVIAQHMPGGFVKDLAKYLDGECRIRVKEAEEGEKLVPAMVFLAPGRSHLRIVPPGRMTMVEARPELENCPSVDELFKSAAEVYGDRLMAVVLTGMGNDGAAGVRAVKAAGGRAIAQDEETSKIFGMPREAAATGLLDKVVPLGEVSRHIVRFATNTDTGVTRPGLLKESAS